MANHQYISVKRPAGCFYVEGTYNQNFIEWLKRNIPAADRSYEPEAKRWKIDVKYLNRVVGQARATFDKVLYCEGSGDYDEITIGGTTWKQEPLDL